ncbi:hypothetical protein B9T62_01110 [Paenibacillus donghaensis]|uniref:Uncharacterized protein n=2 Tax=Paenibacillus donghaensis TaxID=414771 RepID=A0A2Z2KIA6_9BACL|nr:hypothetical protein B9T62_01110 [Paenibacillus donghaensis]
MGTIKVFGLIGLVIGLGFFILSFFGLNIPIVVNTTTYDGTTAALMKLIGIPILALIIGSIVSIFSSFSSNR